MAKISFYESKWFHLFDIWWSSETSTRKLETMAAYYRDYLSPAGKKKFMELVNKK